MRVCNGTGKFCDGGKNCFAWKLRCKLTRVEKVWDGKLENSTGRKKKHWNLRKKVQGWGGYFEIYLPIFALTRLSTMTASYPALITSIVEWPPMNPAPPVTKTHSPAIFSDYSCTMEQMNKTGFTLMYNLWNIQLVTRNIYWRLCVWIVSRYQLRVLKLKREEHKLTKGLITLEQ